MASILNVQQIGSPNNVITIENDVSLSFERTDSYLVLPKGSTADRYQTPGAGSIRWNTDEDFMEVFDGTVWRATKQISDWFNVQGNWQLSLDSADTERSYPGYGEKWFNNAFEPYKTIFAATPAFVNSNDGYLDFDGSTNYATTTINAALKPTTAITQECWFKLDASANGVFIGLQYGISSNNAYALWFDGTNWKGGVNISGSLTVINHARSTTPLNNGQWYNFVHSYNSGNTVVSGQCTTQNGSNILEITSGNFDYIVGMTVTGTGIPNDPDGDPPVLSTITAIDPVANTITLSQNATESTSENRITATLEPHQFLYINGELVEKLATTGDIEYVEDNNLLVIGGDFNGPGTSTGITSLIDGAISVVRVGSFSASPTLVKSNFNAIKGRYGL